MAGLPRFDHLGSVHLALLRKVGWVLSLVALAAARQAQHPVSSFRSWIVGRFFLYALGYDSLPFDSDWT
jgi:hypothetical protein